MVTVTVPSLSMRTKAEGCCVGLRLDAAGAPAVAMVCACVSTGKAPSAKPLVVATLRKLRR